MRILAIIPARYASSRFPGKPLVDIHGKSMIQRVWEQVKKCSQIHKIIVATDDTRILNAVVHFGGEAMMTSTLCKTGTDRCAEVIEHFDHYDIIVNIQGDEPFIDSSQINTVIEILKNNKAIEISTLAKKISDVQQLFNPNVVKLVLDNHQKALYFSRNPIPYFRNFDEEQWLNHHTYYKHIGLYGYRLQSLKNISKLTQSPLELAESLEQLRWLENGYSIGVGITEIETQGIDTPEDLEKILKNQ